MAQANVAFWAVFVGALYIAPLVSSSDDQQPDPCATKSYYHAVESQQGLYPLLSDAIVRIEIRSDSSESPCSVGTGFFVDSVRGYLLTAFHVADDRKCPHSRIFATSPTQPDTEFELTLVPGAQLPDPADVALLQVKEKASLAKLHVRSLDVALHFLAGGSRYWTAGFPRGKTYPDPQSAEYMGLYEGNPEQAIPANFLMTVRQHVDAGNSGAPLIDEQGAVIAICVEEIDNNYALYVPLVRVQRVFAKIPPDLRTTSLDSDLLKCDPKDRKAQDHWIHEMEWKPGNPSNLELYEWAFRIAENLDNYQKHRALFSCPIIPAYGDRRLAEAEPVKRISSLASGTTQAAIYRRSAESALALGWPDVALADSEIAAAKYDSIKERAAIGQSFALAGRASFVLGRYDNASSYLEKALGYPLPDPEVGHTKLQLAVALQSAGDTSKASEFYQRALPDLQRAGNLNGQAAAFKGLGKLEVSSGENLVGRHDLQQSYELYAKLGDVAAHESVGKEIADLDERQRQAKFRRAVDLRNRSLAVWFDVLVGLICVYFLRQHILLRTRKSSNPND